MSTEEDFFDDVGPSDVRVDPTPPSDQSTPLELSDVTGVAESVGPQDCQEGPRAGHVCHVCLKSLSSKSSLRRHLILHKLNDINARKPQEDELKRVSSSLFQDVIDEIKKEPSVGEMGTLKQKFVTEVDLSSDTATDLIEAITSVTIDIVLTKNKVMPSVHLEEALLKLNHLLCNRAYCDSIKSKLTHLFNLSSEFELPEVVDMVYQRLVWRICTKMMYKLQEQVFFLMKRNHQAAHKEYKMSDGEVIIFRKHIGTLLRSVYSMGCSSKNNVWQLRCRTLREKFVESVSTLTNEMFLDVKLWVSGDIFLSETALSMFLGIEKIIQSLQDKGLPCLASNIFDDLTNAENIILLEKLRTLSRGILAEDLALDFINDLVQCYSVVSGRLHAKLKVQQISGKEINIATTRENLKRNPTNPKKIQESVGDKAKSSDVDSIASTGKSHPSNASSSTAGSEVKSSSTKSRKKKSDASVSPSTSKPEAKSRARGKKSTLTDLPSKPATQAKPSKSRKPPTSTASPSTSATKGKKTAASVAPKRKSKK